MIDHPELLESRIALTAPLVMTFAVVPSGTVVVGSVPTLVATASDPDSGDQVTALRFYDDANSNGLPESSELIDSDFFAGDGWSIDWDTKNHATGAVTLLAVAEDVAKTPSVPRPLSVTLVSPPVNQPPVVQTFSASPPSPILIGWSVSLTATASDSDVGDSVKTLRFYEDQNGNGSAESGELIDSDIDPTNGWQIIWETAGHAVGPVTLLAVAEDISKTPSVPRSLNLTLANNTPPVVSAFASSLSSPITIGQTTVLSALVSDPDVGDSVSAVRFYEDRNGDGIAGIAELINSDLNGADGWSINWNTTGHPIVSATLLAVAEDQLGESSTPRTLSLAFVAPPSVISVASHKLHGGLPFALNLGTGTGAAIEPRLNGPDNIVFTFSETMRATDGVLSANEFSIENATFSSATFASNTLTLALTGVVDQSVVRVALNGLSDLDGNALAGIVDVGIRALFGDVNQSGNVSVSDLQGVKNRLLQTAAATNYLFDVNASGSISVSDLQAVKNNLLHTVAVAAPAGLNAALAEAIATVGVAPAEQAPLSVSTISEVGMGVHGSPIDRPPLFPFSPATEGRVSYDFIGPVFQTAHADDGSKSARPLDLIHAIHGVKLVPPSWIVADLLTVAKRKSAFADYRPHFPAPDTILHPDDRLDHFVRVLFTSKEEM